MMDKCSNEECPYGLEQYSKHPQWKGLCLNCLDDEARDKYDWEVNA